MAGRPYWSGQLKISLVSFGIQLFPATTSQAGIAFHQIDRATGQRVRHLNVIDGDQPVENAEIVKGYEYSKGKYLVVEPDEVAKLRIETKNVVEVRQFAELDELMPALFEKPYFVVPEPKESPDAFAVVHKAMEQSGKAALGEIAFAGREHLVAIAVPPDRTSPGMMAYTLRYREELRDSAEYFSGLENLKNIQIDRKQLELANQLVEAYTRPLKLEDFADDYEAALRELIDAKQKSLPLPFEEEPAKPAKVVNLMDALRQSLSEAKRPAASRAGTAKGVPKKGPVLVGASKRKHKVA